MKNSTALSLLAMFYAISETWHYGWHWSWKSDAEVIADGIALLIMALAWVANAIERK